MKCDVVTLDNKKSGSVELDDMVFGIVVRKEILAKMVDYQLAKRRSGNHKTKTIGEIRGSTAKPWRQKGTGRARIGSIRNPSRVHGSKAFGPKPHKYKKKANKKVKQLARRSVLSQKVAQNNFIVLDNVVPGSPKTSEFFGILKKLNLSDKKVTILAGEMEDNLYFGSRNIKNICVVPAHSASTYDLLDCQLILADVESVEILNNQLSN